MPTRTKISNSRKSINPTKMIEQSVDENCGVKKEYQNTKLQKMQQEMTMFFNILLVDNASFDEHNAFQELERYIKNNNRILYSTVSHIVYDIQEDIDTSKEAKSDKFGTLLSNIEKLVDYVSDDLNISVHVNAAKTKDEKDNVYDTQKAVWKIWDHVNLANRQYKELKQTDSEYDAKFEKRIDKFQGKITKEIYSQLLSIVGIFTALSFLIFGGISSLENVLAGLHESALLKLLIIGAVWSIGMLNITFVFLFCVGKMTKLNYKSSDNPNATFWQKYPVVCYTNFFMLSTLVILLWLYYSVDRCNDSWISWLIEKNPPLVGALGLLILVAVSILMFIFLLKLTNSSNSDN